MATQLLKTVKPSGGDYTTLEACMNANEQDLVTADKYFDVEIDGTWSSADTTAVTIHNYTTDATRYINIYTTSGCRHAGVYSTSKYRVECSVSGDSACITANSNYSYLKGIQIQVTADNANGHGLRLDAYACKGSSFIIKGVLTNNTGWNIGLNIGEIAGQSIAYNNIIYGFAGADRSYGIRLAGSGGFSLNNTVYGCHRGIGGAGTYSVAKNNLSYNNDHDYTDTFDADSTNNLSKDTTAPAINTYYISKTITFVNAGTDFHLVSTDTDAIDLGADLSGTFTDDIDGVTRSGTWDIGADEYVAAGGTTVTPDPIALTASLPTLTLNYDWQEVLSKLNLTASLPTLSVNYDYNLILSLLNLTVSLQSPIILSGTIITPDILTLSASLLDPTVQFDYLYAVAALNLTINLLSPDVAAGTIISIDPLALTAGLKSPTINFDYLIQLATLDLTSALKNPAVNFDFAVDMTALAISSGLLNPSVVLATGRTYLVFNSSANRLELWVGGTEVARFNQNGSIDVNGAVNQNAF